MTQLEAESTARDKQIDAMLRLASLDPSLNGLTRETFELYTCLHKAYMRHVESQRPDAIVRDPYAAAVAGKAGAVQWQYCSQGGNMDDIANVIALRTRFTDELIRTRPSDVQQIVLIGDGLETRAYRLPELQKAHVFELHQDATTLAHKTKVFHDLRVLPISEQRDAFVVDFKSQEWTEQLLACGFEVEKPTYWIVEGIMSHTDIETNRRMLASIDRLSAPESKLWTDAYGSGKIDVETGDDGGVVVVARDFVGYGEDASVFCSFPWMVELQLRRNQAGEHYGTKWDAERFARVSTVPENVRLGPYYFVLFTKSDEVQEVNNNGDDSQQQRQGWQ